MGLRSTTVSILFVFAHYFSHVVIHQVAGADPRPQCVHGPGKIGYNLYNSDYPNGTIVDIDSETIPLKKDAPIFVFIHGFTADPYSIRWLTLGQCLITKHVVNLIVVDWREGSCTSGGNPRTRLAAYSSAVKNSRLVGKDIAEFVTKLVSDYEVKVEDIHVVGHSLGAHVGSFCAKLLQENKIGVLGEIWGLDPAGPGFNPNNCKSGLCLSDAKFLQILHSSAAYGISKAIGNKDFYFNGGSKQPNCPAANMAMCSHASAIEYLIHIICEPDCKYVGKKWNRLSSSPPAAECSDDTCSELGLKARQSLANGTFHVDTTKLPAHCVTFIASTPAFGT